MGRRSVEGRQVRVKEGDFGVGVARGSEEGVGRRYYEVKSAGTNEVEKESQNDTYGRRRLRLL